MDREPPLADLSLAEFETDRKAGWDPLEAGGEARWCLLEEAAAAAAALLFDRDEGCWRPAEGEEEDMGAAGALFAICNPAE